MLASALGLACLSLQPEAAEATNTPQVGPAPAWVRPATTIPPDVQDLPVVVRLSDVQLDFDAEGWTEYRDLQVKVQSAVGLQVLSAIPFQWSPWSDTLTVHRINILRDGQTPIDILPKDGGFTVLRRETGLEQATLTGVLTALVQPDGLQVGDTLEIAISIHHADPLLKQHASAMIAGWDLAPISRFRLQARWPSALPVRRRCAAPRRTGPQSPAWSWTTCAPRSHRPTPRPAPLPAQPPSRVHHPGGLEGRVGAYGPALRQGRQAGAELRSSRPGSPNRQDDLRPKARTAAALRLVQDQVRYLAHGEGDGGYTPPTADETWKRRYGDCKAKTVLLLALLHELGVSAEPVAASIGGGDGLDEHLPSATLFNHVCVRARIDGRDYWLDGARQGDRSLDDLATPAYGWVLPMNGDGKLVRVVAAAPSRPQMLQVIRYDASGGVTAPEPTHLETVVRGDASVLLHTQLSAVPPERMDEALKTYWSKIHTAFTATRVSAAWDPATGEEKLIADGTSKLDWSGSGLELQHVVLGGAPEIKRDPAATDPDAPYAVDYPAYVETDESVVLPSGDVIRPESLKVAQVDKTVAAVAYRRTATVTGNVLRVVATSRALRPEISAAEARASVDPLTRLGEQSVFASAGLHAKQANDKAWIDSHPTTLDGHLDRGEVLLNTHRYREALVELEAAAALDPTSQKAWAAKAITHAWLSDPQALADADKADALGKPNVVSARARGLLAERTGDREGARAHFARALALVPDDDFTLDQLIQLDLEAARKHVDQLVHAHPDLAGHIHLWRATLAWAAHDREAAAKEVALAPGGTADELLQRAQGYLQVNDKDHARADVDAALKLEPSIEAWLERASLDGYGGAQGAADVDAALKLDPTAKPARVNVAVLHKDYVKALSLMDGLIKDHPEDAGRLIATQAYYEGLVGRNTEMDADFERAHKVAGSDAPRAATLCGWELEASWRPEAALADCDRAVAEAPRSLGLQLERIALLHRLGRDADKILDAAEAANCDPASLNDICYTLAVQQVRLNRALAACEASLRLRPGDAATLDSQGFVLMRLGRDAEAVKSFDAALAIYPSMADSLYVRGLVEASLGRSAKGDVRPAFKVLEG